MQKVDQVSYEKNARANNGAILYEEVSDTVSLCKDPLVSVCMITYNHEIYIREAIENVVGQQTDFPFELIIGEDCSTDRTREICLEYQKKFPSIIRILISDNNVGMINNGRRTSGACRGKYIAFCEGDDYWHNPLKLKKQVEYLETYQDVGLIHSDVDRHIVELNKTIPNYYRDRINTHSPREGVALICDMISSNYIVTTCSAVVRRQLLEDIHAECQYEFSNKFMMTDTQTWIEVAHRSKIAYLSESLATYRVLPESACRSKDAIKYLRFNKNAFEMLIHYTSKYTGSASFALRKLLAGRRIDTLLDFANQQQFPELAKEARVLAVEYRVRLSNLNILRYYCSQNYLLFLIVRLILSWHTIYKRVIFYPKRTSKKTITL